MSQSNPASETPAQQTRGAGGLLTDHTRRVRDTRTNLPPGIPYIIGNEAAERFSYYGMRGILMVFMTQYLLGADGTLAPMGKAEATSWYHLFMTAVYATPVVGALLSDVVLGKYRTILYLSIVYCLGHLALALDETRLGLAVGLALIAVGAGGIKPCVSAHVGDQFGPGNQHMLERVYGWFYLSINLGAAISTLLTPWLLKEYGASEAFAVPGVLMLIATLVFFAGRRKFVQIPPAGMQFFRQISSPEGWRAVVKLCMLYVFVAIFWCLYDQTGSTWVLQATQMDTVLLGHDWQPAQIQAVNPILILLYIPIFSYVIFPAVGLVVRVTPLRKIATGFFLTALSFVVVSVTQERIADGETVNVVWQIIAYAILTAGEVLISVTFLEFSYSQAPPPMKSVIMALYFLSVSAGNLLTAVVTRLTGDLTDAERFWFFTGMQFVAALVFVGVAAFYPERTYIAEEKVAAA